MPACPRQQTRVLQHRNKLASGTAETGIRIAAEAKRVGKGSAREAFLGALGRRADICVEVQARSHALDRPARLTPQAPRKALILGTKVQPLSYHTFHARAYVTLFRWRPMLFYPLPKSLNARRQSRCAAHSFRREFVRDVEFCSDSVAYVLMFSICLKICYQRERAEARDKSNSKKEEKSSNPAAADKAKSHPAGASDAATKKEKVDAKQKQKPRDAASAAPPPPVAEPAKPARELTEQDKQVRTSVLECPGYATLLRCICTSPHCFAPRLSQVFGSRIYLLLEPTHGARTGASTMTSVAATFLFYEPHLRCWRRQNHWHAAQPLQGRC